MSTFKMTTLVGESSEGFEDAIRTALKTSGDAVRGQTWMKVSDIRANLGEGAEIDRWQVAVEVAFKVEEEG